MTTSRSRYLRLMEHKSLDAPYCLCGCGNKTNWSIRTKSYGRYLFNHQLPDKTNGWTEQIEQIVRGTVLGDGHLDVRKGRKGILTGKARLSIRHSTKRQLPYTEWLYQHLLPITTGKVRIRQTPKAFGSEIAEFSTVSLPQLYDIWQETYKDRRKIVTQDYLDKLSDLSVAIWWCDDGSNNSMSTHSFTLEENHLISCWLNHRYHIESFVVVDRRVNLPYIRCHSDSARKFFKAIFPYVEESLWYKFSRFLPELLRQESKVSSQQVPPPPTT